LGLAVRAELRRIHSPDAGELKSWSPADEDFGILFQLMVGPEDEAGEESFDVTVCTGGWLDNRIREAGILDLRHHVSRTTSGGWCLRAQGLHGRTLRHGSVGSAAGSSRTTGHEARPGNTASPQRQAGAQVLSGEHDSNS
jgi:hypothetical protein